MAKAEAEKKSPSGDLGAAGDYFYIKIKYNFYLTENQPFK